MTYDLDKYSHKEREEMALALEACKQYLWDGREETRLDSEGFICCALPPGCNGTFNAMELIAGRLAPHTTVGPWLAFATGIPSCRLSSERKQAYRHAWVSELIRELRA